MSEPKKSGTGFSQSDKNLKLNNSLTCLGQSLTESVHSGMPFGKWLPPIYFTDAAKQLEPVAASEFDHEITLDEIEPILCGDIERLVGSPFVDEKHTFDVGKC